MKIHMSKKGCTSTFPDCAQRTVDEAAGETQTIMSRAYPYSAVNTQLFCMEKPPFERPDGLRITVRFPPAADKVAWKNET